MGEPSNYHSPPPGNGRNPHPSFPCRAFATPQDTRASITITFLPAQVRSYYCYVAVGHKWGKQHEVVRNINYPSDHNIEVWSATTQ